MTYLDRLKKIEKKMSVLRVGIAECEREYSELLCDMADEIESLSDELRALKSNDYLRRAYGD